MEDDKSAETPVPTALREQVRSFIDAWTQDTRGHGGPPGLIYHYCDASALLNIFRTNSLWATGTRYLNDTSELVSGLQNLPITAKHHLRTPTGRLLYQMTEVMRGVGVRMLSHAIGGEIYVACFSEDPDILGQWRAYADDGLGFAIGFDARKLRVLSNGDAKAGDIRRMIYTGDEQQIIDNLFEGMATRIKPYLHLFKLNKEKAGPFFSEARRWLSLRFSEALIELAFQCKHRSFREEKEWRIRATEKNVQFRSSHGRIVPYTSLDMTSITDNKLMPVERIVMGPKLHRQDTERVLMYLAEEYGYGHSGFEIAQSESPYR